MFVLAELLQRPITPEHCIKMDVGDRTDRGSVIMVDTDPLLLLENVQNLPLLNNEASNSPGRIMCTQP